jgi:hypothetical protein
VVTGLVVKESDQVVQVIENPLVSPKPTEIPTDSIDRRRKSATSLMPKGLLDKLTRDEILDLLAFLVARGDKDHELFQAGGHAHHEGHK